jgi:mismatch-specific thymine-DNA glycosylase
VADDWQTRRLPVLFPPGLRVLFVGINPGRASALAGHHFAGRQTTFWRLLLDSGLTPRLLTYEEDSLLLTFGIGITNLIDRPSRGEDDLVASEFVAGARRLRARVHERTPRVVALLGRRIAQAYAEDPSAGAGWGVVATAETASITMALPNPSSRSRVPYETRLEAYRAAAALAGEPS